MLQSKLNIEKRPFELKNVFLKTQQNKQKLNIICFSNFPTLNHWIYLCFISAVLHIIIINLYDYWSLLITCFLLGIAYGTTVAQTPAIMVEATGLEKYTQGMALVNVMIGLGNMIGPLLGGKFGDSYRGREIYTRNGIGECNDRIRKYDWSIVRR